MAAMDVIATWYGSSPGIFVLKSVSPDGVAIAELTAIAPARRLIA
jgi:hypothetical protein